MPQIITTVNDDFTQDQLPGPSATGPWTPINSERTLTGASSSITGGQYVITAGTTHAIIYDAPATVTYNISNLESISLIGMDITVNIPPGIIRLEIDSQGGGTGFLDIVVTTGTTSVTWDLSDPAFAGVDLTNVIRLTFTFTRVIGSVDAIVSNSICVAKDTMVLMADGTEKPIQNIRRDDLVAGDIERKTINRVARLVRSALSGATPLRIMKINKNAINDNLPNRDLIISGGHPILYNGKRYRAKSFKRFNGVKYWDRSITAKEILTGDSDGDVYSLYNIQYEHNGFFVANGIVVDSLPPLSVFAPLPKELYFNKELYDKPSTVLMPKLCKEILKNK